MAVGNAFGGKARSARGAVGVYLDTFEYQAPEFYARLGYSEIARLPGPDPVEDRVFFAKRLS